MVHMGERHGVGPALAQVSLAGVAGALVVSCGIGPVVVSLFGGPVVAVVVGGVLVVVLVAALTAAASVAPGESWLTGNVGGRVCWALLVGGAGTGAWLLAWSVSDEARLGLSESPWLWWPATALLFALVAGVLLRRWYLALTSFAVLVAVALLMLRALAGALPSDVEQRLAASQVPRTSMMVTAVPGYHLVPAQGVWHLVPDDLDPNAPSPDVSLHALPDGPDCRFEPHDSRYPFTDRCEVERPGLFFLDGTPVRIGYAHRVGTTRLLLTAPPSFDRAVLREAVLTARVTDGVATAVVPGYSAGSASPQGTHFTPDDRSLLPGARYVSVGPRLGAGFGECTFGAQVCETESPALRYERFTDGQMYVRTEGGREFEIRGGPGVDREVLRTAALAARSATDEEALAMLPPPPPSPPDRSLMASVRTLSRTLFN
ncbi:hypothetical protein AB0A63_37570 [Lentzea sp. NPDC042327]|uniref:hypothetical protein n=1 Tax=Lentzea sp. NPDC042327 TaxID=3154801 RepID=UPI0033C6FAFF